MSLALICVSGCSGNKDLYEPVMSPTVKNRIAVKSVWTDQTGGSYGYYSQIRPAIDGKVIYSASREGEVQALNIETGRSLWYIDLDDEDENDDRRSARISGAVAARGPRVAVGTENGYIYVINASDGNIAWKKYISNEIVAAPEFSKVGDKLFVLDSVGRLVCFNAVDGEELWTSGDVTNKLHLRSQSRPVVIGNRYVLVGQSSGKVQVISQDNGALLTEIAVGKRAGASTLEQIADVSSDPLILGDNLYTSAFNAGFLAYDLANNTEIARLGYRSSKPIAFDSKVLVLTEDNGQVVCLDRRDFHEIWSNNQLSYRNVTGPCIYGNYAVVADMEGYVYFMNLDSGFIDSKVVADFFAIQTPPQVYESDLIVFSTGGILRSLRYDPDGTARAKYEAAQQELETAGVGVNLQQTVRDDMYNVGVTMEQLQARRRHAQRIVNQIEAQERAALAREREYQRQKAAYEREKAAYEKRVKEYEQKRRKEMSGFGIIPGVKSQEAQ